jgi:c-di-GMP-binding flagellar brake protein YcgR
MPFSWWGLRKTKKPSKEARRHIRTATALLCEVELEDGTRAKGDIVNLTVQGAQVRLAFEQVSSIEVDQKIRLMIEGPNQEWSVRTRAHVCHVRGYRGGWTHVGVEFQDLGTLYSQLENSLSTYFNRRRNKRVSMTGAAGFAAKLKHGRVVETARVNDISLGGMSVLMSAFQSSAFEQGSKIELHLVLPGTKKELVGKVIVRHRQRAREVDRLGLEFDQESSNGFARHVPAIERFLERMQRANVKTRRPRSA